jgi:hypothetical protein
VPGILRKSRETDASPARIITPDHLAGAVNVTLSFWQLEAKRYRPVYFQFFASLYGKAIFVQIEQFTKIHNQTCLGTIETGINRRVEFLANRAAPLF